MRIYRNCSDQQYYENQSKILLQRFIEKGYKKEKLEMIREKVKKMDRGIMITSNKKKTKNKYLETAFLTGFNRR